MFGATHLAERKKWRGEWWLPANPLVVVPGTLTWDPADGAVLELIGGFDTDVHEEIRPGVYAVRHDSTPLTIHGLVGPHRATLLRSHMRSTRRRLSSAGVSLEQDLTPEMVLIGDHVASANVPVFRRVRASLQGLTAWSGESPLTVDLGRGSGPDVITVRDPTERVVVVRDVTYRFTGTTFGPDVAVGLGPTEVAARHLIEFESDCSRAASLEDLLDHVGGIADLLSLARHSRTRVLTMRAETLETARLEPRRRNWVEILYRQPPGVGTEEESTTPDFAFTANSVNLEEMLGRWVKMRERLRASLNMLVSSWSPGWYLEARVLALITALESLDAGIFDDQHRMSDREFKSLREAVLGAAPGQHHEWLASTIHNSLPLKERLLRLANRLPEEVRQRLVPSSSAWIRAATRTRNDISHRGTTTLEREELFALGQVTEAVLYLLLLGELGLPDDVLLRRTSEDSDLAHTCTLAIDHFSG